MKRIARPAYRHLAMTFLVSTVVLTSTAAAASDDLDPLTIKCNKGLSETKALNIKDVDYDDDCLSGSANYHVYQKATGATFTDQTLADLKKICVAQAGHFGTMRLDRRDGVGPRHDAYCWLPPIELDEP